MTLEPGTVQEVILSQERVQIVKHLYAVQDVSITKTTQTVLHTIPVELAYEELVVDQRDMEKHLQDADNRPEER